MPVQTTKLEALHRAHGGRMVDFAGWSMPVQYAAGIMAEHLHARAHAALFDVSHMAQVSLAGEGLDEALEKLVPADVAGLKVGRQRYTQFLNEAGGIIDDLMISRLPDQLLLVVNAANAGTDIAHLRAHLPGRIRIIDHRERALLALQGPQAEQALKRQVPEVVRMRFMDVITTRLLGRPAVIARSGYTGDDGFEIALDGAVVEEFATLLLRSPEVKLAGLGARDTLRLEAGLPLHGNDIAWDIGPVEAGLSWSIAKRRRLDGGFAGADAVLKAIVEGPARVRVGLRPEGRALARLGTVILDADGGRLGAVSSGGFSPTLNAPIAMGYVAASAAAIGTRVWLDVRGQKIPALVTALPFVPHRYRKTGEAA